MEEPEAARDAFFQDMEAGIAASSSAPLRCVGMEILEALISEFAPETSSQMGMPWEYHEKCRVSLEVRV